MSDQSNLLPANLVIPSDLPALIAQGEGETLEFKRSVAELEQVVETVAALANTRSGLVLIGVGPTGEIVGVDVGQVTGERIANRIEVQSPGRLPAPLTLDTLGEEYALRNRVIAELLFNIRYIERWNTGILRMRQLMRAHGLPEPVFQQIGETFRVTFPGPGDSILDLIPEAAVTDLRALGLNERQVQALALMVNEGQKLTNRQYRDMFGTSHMTAFRDLNQLVETGQARVTGSGRTRQFVA